MEFTKFIKPLSGIEALIPDSVLEIDDIKYECKDKSLFVNIYYKAEVNGVVIRSVFKSSDHDLVKMVDRYGTNPIHYSMEIKLKALTFTLKEKQSRWILKNSEKGFSSKPHEHKTLKDAYDEAVRLSKMCGSIPFEIYEIELGKDHRKFITSVEAEKPTYKIRGINQVWVYLDFKDANNDIETLAKANVGNTFTLFRVDSDGEEFLRAYTKYKPSKKKLNPGDFIPYLGREVYFSVREGDAVSTFTATLAGICESDNPWIIHLKKSTPFNSGETVRRVHSVWVES